MSNISKVILMLSFISFCNKEKKKKLTEQGSRPTYIILSGLSEYRKPFCPQEMLLSINKEIKDFQRT